MCVCGNVKPVSHWLYHLFPIYVFHFHQIVVQIMHNISYEWVVTNLQVNRSKNGNQWWWHTIWTISQKMISYCHLIFYVHVLYFIFPLIIFYWSISLSFHLLSQSTEWRTSVRTNERTKNKMLNLPLKRTTVRCAYGKVNTPVQFYLFLAIKVVLLNKYVPVYFLYIQQLSPSLSLCVAFALVFVFVR